MIWISNIWGVAKECFAFGLTSLHDCGISEHTLSLLEKSQSKKSFENECFFALLSDNPDYYEKNGLKEVDTPTEKSQLAVWKKFMQMELWEVEVLVC